MKKGNVVFASAASLSVLPSPFLLAPFFLQLLAIALMPFVAPHWWERNYPKVSMLLGSITLLYYLLFLHGEERLFKAFHEYASFIILMAALFIVAGGIHLEIKGETTPRWNVLFLIGGAILANLIGTTGASMLLIRPWIRMNKYRISGFHTVFFIFLISNVGGGLTPIGDPPLFLGFLKGVPFWWTLQHLWPMWLMVMGVLLGVFYLIDRENFLRAPRAVFQEKTGKVTWDINGVGNLLPLAVILVSVFLPTPWREFLMVAAALFSWYLTPRLIHVRNAFTFAPIKEVAWLFLGIFATMIPALDYLEHQAVALTSSFKMESVHFYYFTGLLSSLLDNAPAYLAFLSMEMGLQGETLENSNDVLRVAMQAPNHLIAISLGAVFFGAMTYIGNGPNFMVKSIVSGAGVKTPDFFSYLFRYAMPILLPVLALAGWLFLR